MALFFILFIPFTFICVMVIKSSMNYEFGSDRRKRTVRLSVFAATLVVVIAHSIMATALMEFVWTGPTRDDPAATLVIHFAAATTGTLIWGFIVPKVVFSFVGTKPVKAGENGEDQHYVDEIILWQGHEGTSQPETARQQTQTHEAQLYPWKEEPPKKRKKSILIGASALALLSVGAIAILAFMLAGNSPSRTTLGSCDTWLRQQLVGSPQATANAANANAVVAAIQDQRPDSCPPSAWNPLVTNVSRDHQGRINIRFSTTTGNIQGTAVTMPADSTPRWVYLATGNQWYSSAEDSSPILVVRPTGTPLESPTHTPRPPPIAELAPAYTPMPRRPTVTPYTPRTVWQNVMPTPAQPPAQVTTGTPTPSPYKPTPPTTAVNTQKRRTGEITTSLGQQVRVNVSGFNDSPMRFDQLVRIINETERLLGIPYPAPVVTMLRVNNLDNGFCGNNQMSYATRYVADPYVVENSAIKMRVYAECNKTFAAISHEVAHTWFHGNNDWIDEGLANAIEYQLLAILRPIQGIYPPVTYCQTYRNISELESATPKRENKDEHAGFSCNYRLGDGIMGALRQHHEDRGFNSRIAQLARQREASSKRAYDITDIRKTLGNTSPALTIINRWYQGKPQMRRYRHLDAIEWISPPIIDGQYLHFAGRIRSEATVFEPIIGKDPYCSQFVLREGVNKTDYVASLADPLAVGWTYDETPKATIINESIDSATGYFEATAKLNDQSIAGRHNLTLNVKSRVTTGADGYCETGTKYAQIKVEQGPIPDRLKLVKHYHQDEIDWLTEPRLEGNNIMLSGAANPGTLTLHYRNGYCGQLHVYDLTDQGYIYVDHVATILPEDRHWTETPEFEATGWHENSNGAFNAVVKVRNNALDGLSQPILVVQTPARSDQATNQCGESENIAVVDIMR